MRKTLWLVVGTVVCLAVVPALAQIVGMDGRGFTNSRLYDGVAYYKGLVAGDPVDATPTSPTATDYLPVRLSDGTSFYVAGGGGGGGDGKILDGTAVGEADVLGSAPGGSEQGLITRNIPSGTQPISGTITSNQGGTWTLRLSDGTDTAQVTTTSGGSVQVECVAGCGTPAQAQTYLANVIASAAAANKDHLNIFNASGSGKVLRVLSVKIAPSYSAAVTGVAQSFILYRTSTVGTTCTTRTIVLLDTANSAVPAQVTANTNCTTNPTAVAELYGCVVSGDETHAADPDGQCYRYSNSGGQPITLREGQGMMLLSTGLSGAWPVTATVEFSM